MTDEHPDELFTYETNRLYRKLNRSGLYVSKDGTRRKVHYIPTDGFGATAYIRLWPVPFGPRIECVNAGRNVLYNLMVLLRTEGWEECK